MSEQPTQDTNVSTTTTPPPTTTAEAPPATTTETAKPEPSLLNQKTEETAKPEGPPEKYEDWKLPDGYELDAKVAEAVGPLFKELGLSQAAAQKLVDFYSEHAIATHNEWMETWKATREGWLNEVKADPEIGGKLDQVKATVARAIDGLGDAKLASEFRAAMDLTGAGNHPAFIRAFYKLAQKVTEGQPLAKSGGPTNVSNPTGRPRTAAQAIFPNLPSSG